MAPILFENISGLFFASTKLIQYNLIEPAVNEISTQT